MDVASAKLIGAGLAAIGVGAAAAGVGYERSRFEERFSYLADWFICDCRRHEPPILGPPRRLVALALSGMAGLLERLHFS